LIRPENFRAMVDAVGALVNPDFNLPEGHKGIEPAVL
jgi:hypothetical protein